jgi:hypothetical protein
MAAKQKKAPTAPRYPERKWGPFHGGLSVCVWTNEVENGTGKRFFRSVTISPRRYLDPKTGEWEDAGSLRPADLPSLILALEAAHDFVSSTPLPGKPMEGEEPADATAPEHQKIPF